MKRISICDVAGLAIFALVTCLQVLSQRASEPYQRCRLGTVSLAAVIREISLAWGFLHMTLPRFSSFSGFSSSTFATAKICCFLSFLEALDTIMAAVPHPALHFQPETTSLFIKSGDVSFSAQIRTLASICR